MSACDFHRMIQFCSPFLKALGIRDAFFKDHHGFTFFSAWVEMSSWWLVLHLVTASCIHTWRCWGGVRCIVMCWYKRLFRKGIKLGSSCSCRLKIPHVEYVVCRTVYFEWSYDHVQFFYSRSHCMTMSCFCARNFPKVWLKCCSWARQFINCHVVFCVVVDWLSPENISKKRHKTSSRAKNQQRPSPIVSQLHKHLLVGSLRGSGGVRQKVDIFEIQNLGDIFDVSTSRPYKKQKWQSTVAGSFKVWMMSWKPCCMALLHISCIYSNITNITLKLWTNEEALLLQQGWRK